MCKGEFVQILGQLRITIKARAKNYNIIEEFNLEYGDAFENGLRQVGFRILGFIGPIR